ncbi:MAG TPA: hypothetical protein VKS21_06235, partial [Spirochaetota bacterium]|nr:hypothetical protein [Spirochaetota bacterium]
MKKYIILLILYTQCFFSYGYYYKNDFNVAISTFPEWTNSLFYGRHGAVISASSSSAIEFNSTLAGHLTMRGNPNNAGGADRSGFWVGQWVYLTNKYSANEFKPFGWEIIRKNCLLDIDDAGGASLNDSRLRIYTGLAMFKDTTPPMPKTFTAGNRANEWEYMEQFIDFVDQNACFATSNGDIRQFISLYHGGEKNLNDNCVTATGPEGNKYDISNVVLWDYDNLVNNSTATNTNSLGLRMINNGLELSLFINPDPYDELVSLPNAWLKIYQAGISWYSNMQVMIGHAVRMNEGDGVINGSQIQSADYTGFLIRSAVSGSGYNLLPGPKNSWQLVIKCHIAANDAGVNFIKWKLPPAADAAEPDLISIAVKNPKRENLQLIKRLDHNFPGPAQAAYSINRHHNTVQFILGRQLRAVRQQALTEIIITAETGRSAKNWYPEEHRVYVAAELFPDMPSDQRRIYSTCGPERVAYQPESKLVTL